LNRLHLLIQNDQVKTSESWSSPITVSMGAIWSHAEVYDFRRKLRIDRPLSSKPTYHLKDYILKHPSVSTTHLFFCRYCYTLCVCLNVISIKLIINISNLIKWTAVLHKWKVQTPSSSSSLLKFIASDWDIGFLLEPQCLTPPHIKNSNFESHLIST